MSFRKIWLSDPSTYPVIATVIGACFVCAGFSSRKIFRDPEVTFKPNLRTATLPEEVQVRQSHTWIATNNGIKSVLNGINKNIPYFSKHSTEGEY